MRSVFLLALALLTTSCGGSSSRTSDDGSYGGKGGSVSGGSSQGGDTSGGEGGSAGSGATPGAGGTAGAAGTPSGGTGGSSPSGGTSGSPPSGGSSGMSAAECRTNDDCRLSEDCCSCFAAGPGEALSSCRRACTPTTTACALENATANDVYCSFGRCVLARNCDLRNVTCEIAEPNCPEGMIPSAIGSCYGPCTIVSECAAVTSCTVCEAAGLACVSGVGVGGPFAQCVTTPSACEANPTCACMGVCEGPWQCSDESSPSLDCYCPTC